MSILDRIFGNGASEPLKSGQSFGSAIEEKVERNRQIVEEYKAGASSPELAEKYQVSRERICQILRPYGVIEEKTAERLAAQLSVLEARFAKRRERRETAEKMAEMVRNGASWNEVAIAFGLSRSKASTIRRQSGIKSDHGPWRDFSERKEKIRQLRSEGASWQTVAIACGKTEAAIYRWASTHMRSEPIFGWPPNLRPLA